MNLLLLGVDHTSEEHGHTDVIVLVGLNQQKKSAHLISIPRDTFVHVPGLGYTKINHAHAFGGTELTLKTIQEFLGAPVNYYVEINYAGFVKLVDLLGGVWIENPKPFRVGDGYVSKDRYFPAGRIHLDGDRALEFARFRSDPQGDIGRIRRDQLVVRGLVDRIYDPFSAFRIPLGMSELGKDIKTNMTAADVVRTLLLARWVGERGLESPGMIPGYPRTLYDPVVKAPLSFWVPDLGKTYQMVDSIFPAGQQLPKDRRSYRSALDAAVEKAETDLPPDTLVVPTPADSTRVDSLSETQSAGGRPPLPGGSPLSSAGQPEPAESAPR